LSSKAKLIALVAVTGIVLMSCSVLGGSRKPNPEFDALFDAPSDPLNLDVAVAASQAVTQIFASNGGTLSATGEDGTRYTLDIPAGALYAPAEITMTPASRVGGLPFGEGSTVAVQLEPEGLRFNDVVMLTIETPEAIPVDQQVFFGYNEGGKDFHFVPMLLDTAELKIPITHFSGYGVSKGLAAEIEPVRKRIAGDAEARLTSELAQLLGAERQRQLLGTKDGVALDLGELFMSYTVRYYKEVLEPRLNAAEESCPAGQLALQTLLGVERQAQLLGLEGGLAGALREAGMGAEANRVEHVDDLLLKVGNVCLQEEYELCRDEHIIHRIVPVVLGTMRQNELLGGGSAAMGQLIEKGQALATRCLNFELEFESEIKGKLGTMTYTSSMTSKVPIHFKWEGVLAGNALTGKAPQKNEEFTLKDDICAVTRADRGGAEFEVTALSWDVDYRGKDDKVGFVRDMALSYVQGVSTETWAMRCPGGGTATSAKNSAMWSGAYGMIHAAACSAGNTAPAPQGDPSQA